MPVKTNPPHTQLPATPVRRTMSVTRFGVSLEKVVATIDNPASHHGTERPDAKKSAVDFPERRATNNAGRKQISKVAAMTTQSRVCSCILRSGLAAVVPKPCGRFNQTYFSSHFRCDNNPNSLRFFRTARKPVFTRLSERKRTSPQKKDDGRATYRTRPNPSH